jgi:hypothetical protein
MDLKQYFRKVREIEANIKESYVLISSLETADGGKPGVLSEVSREIAAKVIAEGRAIVASDAEVKRFAEEQSFAKKAAEKAALARRLQVAIIADPSDQLEQPNHSKLTVLKK